MHLAKGAKHAAIELLDQARDEGDDDAASDAVSK
jgi:hypothetical protein